MESVRSAQASRSPAVPVRARAGTGGGAVIEPRARAILQLQPSAGNEESGAGTLDAEGRGEGPIQEGMAAKLGEIAGLGVKVAKTVIIETDSEEGKLLLTKLRSLPTGGELAGLLEATDAFLAMERAPGGRADRAHSEILAQSRLDRARLFSRLGRLWAFDVLIANSDRFQIRNWGNVIVGAEGSVVGIDQSVGVNLSREHLEKVPDMAADFAAMQLKRALDPGRRRNVAGRLVREPEGRSSQPEHDARLRRPEGGVRAPLERGVLKGMADIARLDPAELENKLAELPTFAQEAVKDHGIEGVRIVQQVIANSRETIASQLGAVQKRDEGLKDPRKWRSHILTHLGLAAEEIVSEWPKINEQWTGKDNHWNAKRPQLKKLKNYGRKQFGEASQVKDDDEGASTLRTQLREWNKGMELVWAAGNQLAAFPESSHDTIKPLADKHLVAVREQQALLPILHNV